MNAYTVRVTRGPNGAGEFSLDTYSAIAVSNAAACAHVIAIGNAKKSEGELPIRCAIAEPAAELDPVAMFVKTEIVKADVVAKFERGAYVTGAAVAG